MANIKNAVKLGVFTLAIMNVTAVVSLRGPNIDLSISFRELEHMEKHNFHIFS